jgi:hypothetical protein
MCRSAIATGSVPLPSKLSTKTAPPTRYTLARPPQPVPRQAALPNTTARVARPPALPLHSQTLVRCLPQPQPRPRHNATSTTLRHLTLTSTVPDTPHYSPGFSPKLWRSGLLSSICTACFGGMLSTRPRSSAVSAMIIRPPPTFTTPALNDHSPATARHSTQHKSLTGGEALGARPASPLPPLPWGPPASLSMQSSWSRDYALWTCARETAHNGGLSVPLRGWQDRRRPPPRTAGGHKDLPVP